MLPIIFFRKCYTQSVASVNFITFRITGLDPAGPGFYTCHIEERLKKGDADAVDIIHTDMGLSILGFRIIQFLSQGTFLISGDADFLPNTVH